MMNIENRVIMTVNNMMGMSSGDVKSDSTTDSLCMDSLDHVECIMALEEEFDLEIPDAEAEKITSIPGAIDYITPLVQ